ncbi:hypothetical protein ACFLRT_05100 [Acidobacteriota bacterium]
MKMELLRSIKLPFSSCQIAVAAVARLIAVNCKRDIYVLENSGKEISHWVIPGNTRLGKIEFNPTGTHIVFATEDEICLYHTYGKVRGSRKHTRWGLDSFGHCQFSPDGRYLWAVCPGGDPGNPIVCILDTNNLGIIAESPLEIGEECHFGFHFHPDGKTVFLEAGAGQDGIWTYCCTFAKGCLSVKHLPDLDWQPVYAIHPTGKEILTGSLMDGCMQRRSYPSRKVLVEVEEEYCFVSSDPIYLDPDRILLLTGGDEIYLLDSVSLEIEDRLEVKTDNDFMDIRLLDEILITSHRMNRVIRIWACPR